MAKRPRKIKPTDQASAIERALGGAAPSLAEEIAAAGGLRHFSGDEHIEWVEANCWRDVKGQGWRPLVYSDWQKTELRGMLELRPDGTLRYRTFMFNWPRRCGKSEGAGLYDLHRAHDYDDQVIVIQGNSEDQGEDTVLKTIVDTILNSPRLKARVLTAYGTRYSENGDIEIQSGVINFHRTGSVIKVQPAKEATTYGQKIHVYHNTEGCKAAGDKLYQTGASSTGDAWCGVAIVDSNMGDKDNFVCKFSELAEQARNEERKANSEQRIANPEIGDPTIFCSYVYFDDLADVLRRGCGEGLAAGESPIHPWLPADWIRGRYAQMTRSEFLRNHCNKPAGTGEELWSRERIDVLFRPGLPQYALSPGELARVTTMIGGDGRWKIGVGLDRAGAFSKDPDRTVLTVVGETNVPAMRGQVPVYDELGKAIALEPCDGSVYVWLAAWEFMYQLRDPLQQKILQIDRAVGVGGMCLEAYQASDLAEWCVKQRFGDRTAIRHMTPQAKQQLVQYAHGLVITRRIYISVAYHVLHAEWVNYRENSVSGGIPSYGGPVKTTDLDVMDEHDGHKVKAVTTWTKDDYLESGFWAIEAARGARPMSRGLVGSFPKPPGF